MIFVFTVFTGTGCFVNLDLLLFFFRRLDRVSRKCFLCGKRFSLDTWDRGRHRRECAWRNVKILSSIPTCQATCKHCHAALKIWPSEAQQTFVCQHSRHKSRNGKKRQGFLRIKSFIKMNLYFVFQK